MLFAWLFVALHPTLSTTPHAADPGIQLVAPVQREQRIQLRLVPHVESDLGDLRAREILQRAKAIWKPFVDVLLPTDLGTVASCAPALTVRFTDRGRPAAAGDDGETLGWIDFVDAEPSHVVHVSPQAARTWAAAQMTRAMHGGLAPVQSGLVERALARAVAHEIGHFLLRSRTHAVEGLMKARFSLSDLGDTWPKAAAQNMRPALASAAGRGWCAPPASTLD